MTPHHTHPQNYSSGVNTNSISYGKIGENKTTFIMDLNLNEVQKNYTLRIDDKLPLANAIVLVMVELGQLVSLLKP